MESTFDPPSPHPPAVTYCWLHSCPSPILHQRGMAYLASSVGDTEMGDLGSLGAVSGQGRDHLGNGGCVTDGTRAGGGGENGGSGELHFDKS